MSIIFGLCLNVETGVSSPSASYRLGPFFPVDALRSRRYYDSEKNGAINIGFGMAGQCSENEWRGAKICVLQFLHG